MGDTSLSLSAGLVGAAAAGLSVIVAGCTGVTGVFCAGFSVARGVVVSSETFFCVGFATGALFLASSAPPKKSHPVIATTKTIPATAIHIPFEDFGAADGIGAYGGGGYAGFEAGYGEG